MNKVDRCNEVLAHAHSYQHEGSSESPNRPMEGWSIYRSPTTIHPPTVVRVRYRDANGNLLVDVDCS